MTRPGTGELSGGPEIAARTGVPAIDDDAAGDQSGQHRSERAVPDIGRHHQPHDARSFETLHVFIPGAHSAGDAADPAGQRHQYAATNQHTAKIVISQTKSPPQPQA